MLRHKPLTEGSDLRNGSSRQPTNRVPPVDRLGTAGSDLHPHSSLGSSEKLRSSVSSYTCCDLSLIGCIMQLWRSREGTTDGQGADVLCGDAVRSSSSQRSSSSTKASQHRPSLATLVVPFSDWSGMEDEGEQANSYQPTNKLPYSTISCISVGSRGLPLWAQGWPTFLLSSDCDNK